MHSDSSPTCTRIRTPAFLLLLFRYELDGRPMRINFATPVSAAGPPGARVGGVSVLPPQHGGYGGATGGGNYGGGYGAPSAAPYQAPISKPKPMTGDHRLFVGGLAWATRYIQLKRAFEPFNPTDVKVVMERDNPERSRGFGFVSFATREEAQRAYDAMNGKEVDGRVIRLDFAEPGSGGPSEQGGGGGGGRDQSYGGGGGGGGYGGGGGGGGYGGGGYMEHDFNAVGDAAAGAVESAVVGAAVGDVSVNAGEVGNVVGSVGGA